MGENWLGDSRRAVNLFKSRNSDKDTIQTTDHINDIASHADMLTVMFRKTNFGTLVLFYELENCMLYVKFIIGNFLYFIMCSQSIQKIILK